MEMLNDVLITLTHTHNRHTVFNIFQALQVFIQLQYRYAAAGGTRKRIEYL